MMQWQLVVVVVDTRVEDDTAVGTRGAGIVRYQELLQELRQSQQNVAALTRALPAPALEPTDL